MKLALYQGPSPAGAVDAAFATIDRVLAAAAAAGAGMALFPELFLPGYNVGAEALAEAAQPADGPWMARLASAARAAGCGVTIGFAERAGARVYNSAVALDGTGQRLALYRKIQLFGATEAAVFTPGESYATFEAGGQKAALLICYDIEFAPHVRALAEQGVDLVLVPTANMLPFTHVPRLFVPARAAEMALTVAYANYCGSEGDLDYAAQSVIAGPDGLPLAAAGRGECLLIADLDAVRGIDPARLSTQLADFRPV
jgi:nitrilase